MLMFQQILAASEKRVGYSFTSQTRTSVTLKEQVQKRQRVAPFCAALHDIGQLYSTAGKQEEAVPVQVTRLSVCLAQHFQKNPNCPATMERLLRIAEEELGACDNWILLQGLLLALVDRMSEAVHLERKMTTLDLLNCTHFEVLRTHCDSVCTDVPFRVVALACINFISSELLLPGQASLPSIADLFCTAVSGNCLSVHDVSSVSMGFGGLTAFNGVDHDRIFMTKDKFVEGGWHLELPSREMCDLGYHQEYDHFCFQIFRTALEALTSLLRIDSSTLTVTSAGDLTESSANVAKLRRAVMRCPLQFPSVVDNEDSASEGKYSITNGLESRANWLGKLAQSPDGTVPLLEVVSVSEEHSWWSVQDTVFNEFPPVLGLVVPGSKILTGASCTALPLRAVCGTAASLTQYVRAVHARSQPMPFDWAVVSTRGVQHPIDQGADAYSLKIVPLHRLLWCYTRADLYLPESQASWWLHGYTASPLHDTVSEITRIHSDARLEIQRLISLGQSDDASFKTVEAEECLSPSIYCPGGCNCRIPETSQRCNVWYCPVEDQVLEDFGIDYTAGPFEYLTYEAAEVAKAGHQALTEFKTSWHPTRRVGTPQDGIVERRWGIDNVFPTSAVLTH